MIENLDLHTAEEGDASDSVLLRLRGNISPLDKWLNPLLNSD